MNHSLVRGWIMALLAACAISAGAQPIFHTKRLAELAGKTSLCLPDSLGTLTDNDSTYTWRGHNLRVRTNLLGDVTHIGYSIFPQGMVDQDFLPLLNFVERYFLELSLPSEIAATERMALDHVVITRGGLAKMKRITPTTSFAIDEIERRMFRIRWALEGDSVSLTIPMDYQLLSGASSVELEDIFERDVQRYSNGIDAMAMDSCEPSDTIFNGNYGVTLVGEYLSKEIRSDIYLQKQDDGEYTMIQSESQPLNSLTNIILTADTQHEIPLSLTLNRYGDKYSRMQISLRQLIAYFRNEGCELYVGVKSFDGTLLKASLFAYQPKLAYNHLVSLEVPVSVINGETSDGVKGVAYTYIPLQNVTEQFFIQDFN